MSRSLADAGLTARPRFVKAADLADRDIVFTILGAVSNPNGYNGRAEVVYTIRCLNVTADQTIFDAEGNELTAMPSLSMSLSSTESRQRIADYFRDPHAEPLGPLCFERIAPTRPGYDPFLNIVDYVPLQANGQPIARGPRPQPVRDRTPAPVAGRDYPPDDTDALPF